MPDQLPIAGGLKLRKVCFRLLELQDLELEELAQQHGLEKSELIRAFITQGLKKFGVRKAFLEQKEEAFYCQKCGKPTAKRKLHPVKIFDEEFSFCDTDFFTGTYLEVVRQFI